LGQQPEDIVFEAEALRHGFELAARAIVRGANWSFCDRHVLGPLLPGKPAAA
jgi:hypothetical protein